MRSIRPSGLIATFKIPISCPKSPVKSSRTSEWTLSSSSMDSSLLVVTDEEPLKILADTVATDEGVANRNIVDDGVGCEQRQSPFDVEGIGSRDKGFDELLHFAGFLTHR